MDPSNSEIVAQIRDRCSLQCATPASIGSFNATDEVTGVAPSADQQASSAMASPSSTPTAAASGAARPLAVVVAAMCLVLAVCASMH
jgi:hypothetical protein